MNIAEFLLPGMCLSIPKKIIKAESENIVVESFGGKKEKITASLIKIKKGDWILAQNSIIIKKITAKQAKEISSLVSFA